MINFIQVDFFNTEKDGKNIEKKIQQEIDKQLNQLPRKKLASASLKNSFPCSFILEA